MPFFPLAGAELVVVILLVAIGRWIGRAWWSGELEDETLLRWLPTRPTRPRRPWGRPAEAPPPKLRLIRGGLDGESAAPPRESRASSPRDA